MLTERRAANELIVKSLMGKLTEEEQAELDKWFLSDQENKKFFDKLSDKDLLFQKLGTWHELEASRSLAYMELKERIGKNGKLFNIRRLGWLRYAVAAIVGTLLVIGAFFWLNDKEKTEELAETEKSQQPADILPGKNGAILTLDGGEQIVLDDAADGLLATQGNSRVIKTGSGLTYSPAEGSEVVYNTLTTPRARQFQLELPDGSRIWLNAASSVTYPNVFSGNERKIEITGEAYLEVKKDPTKPFIVKLAGSAEIEVLGTSFNINSYPEEPGIKTTLIEGSVRVRKGDKSVTIKPGQQAELVNDSRLATNDNVDVDAVLAWKNGLIVFDKTDIRVLLRSISRWYDVEFETKGDISVPEFFGKIPRSLNLSEVLNGIHLNSGLNFEIMGNKVIVSK